MKKNRWKILLLIMVLIISISVGILGDTGNHNDYSSNSNNSNSSSSDDDSIIELILWLILSEFPLPIKLGIVIFLAIIFFRFKGSKSSSLNNREVVMSDGGVNKSVIDNTIQIENEIRKIDPNFSTGKFLGWSEEVFMTLQQAWSTRDWDKIRPFEKEELYRKHQLQLQEYINNGTINIVERININQTYLYKYERDKEFEYLTIYLQARMNDYIIDENTKKVVRGDRNKEFHTKYLLTFIRKLGVKTEKSKSNLSTHQCPHCGAPLAITSAGKCDYCDTIVTTGEHDWVLSDLDSIKSDTNLDRGGVRINE